MSSAYTRLQDARIARQRRLKQRRLWNLWLAVAEADERYDVWSFGMTIRERHDQLERCAQLRARAEALGPVPDGCPVWSSTGPKDARGRS